jgi:hypothetical protein
VSVNPVTDPQGAAAAQAERAHARSVRREFLTSPVSAFVRAMKGAITQYLAAREQGVSRQDGIRGLEEELRGAWPKSVSKFKPACDACDDTGYREWTCWDQQRCGREVCAKNPERTHLYVVPCDCAKGDRFRPKTFTPDDQLASVGRTHKKRGGFTRFGR